MSQDLRRRIAEAKEVLSVATGKKAAIKENLDRDLKELRKLLDCKAGHEKARIKELRKTIEDEEAELVKILDRLDELEVEE